MALQNSLGKELVSVEHLHPAKENATYNIKLSELLTQYSNMSYLNWLDTWLNTICSYQCIAMWTLNFGTKTSQLERKCPKHIW